MSLQPDSMKNAKEALKAISTQRALIIGDLMLDTYIYGETQRISREAPVLVVKKQSTEYRLGGAANTAANLRALGVQTRMLSVVGDGKAGEQVLKMLQETGVDTRDILIADWVTTEKTRILAGAFGTGKQQVLRLDEEPTKALPEDIGERLVEALKTAIEDVDFLIVSDYGVGAICPKVIEAVLQIAASGKSVFVDSRFQIRAFKGVRAITPNIPEAEEALGVAISNQEEAQNAGEQLLKDISADAVLLTQGRAGMSLFRQDEPRAHVDIVGEAEVTDVTGAGDTVMANFSAALSAGIGWENAMRLANTAAGVVVAKAGAATATPEEVLSALERYAVELLPWQK